MRSSLSYFFRLQIKRLHRTIGDWGVNPWLVYLGAPLLFVVGSVALFSRTAYASWIYTGIAAVALFQTCGSTRLRFFQQVFGQATYRRIRLIEHILVIASFALFLLYRGEVWFVLGLFVMALAALPFHTGIAGIFALPTPFSKHPFEFAVGFRNSVWVVSIAYSLLIIGIYVGNGYLSMATLGLVILVCANYYTWSEPTLYVWVHRLTPQSFLWMKVRTAVRQLTMVLLPMAAAVGFFFPEEWVRVVAISLTGYGFLALTVIAKYAAFPRGVSIPQGFFMLLSLVFPPLLLISIPYFFRRAKNNISLIL